MHVSFMKTNEPHLPENGLPRCYAKSLLCRTHFGQYQALSAVLEVGTAISCTKSHQVASLIHTMSRNVSKLASPDANVLGITTIYSDWRYTIALATIYSDWRYTIALTTRLEVYHSTNY